MFTASGKIRHQRNARSIRSTAALIAVLVMANLVALAGLGASAQADDFPNVLRYAPMTWEKKAPTRAAGPQMEIVDAAKSPAEIESPAAVEPAGRSEIVPAATEPSRRFAEVRSERPAPTIASVAKAGQRQSLLLIALMSIALATMAGVSVAMFRSLARDIAENERKRIRF